MSNTIKKQATVEIEENRKELEWTVRVNGQAIAKAISKFVAVSHGLVAMTTLQIVGFEVIKKGW